MSVSPMADVVIHQCATVFRTNQEQFNCSKATRAWHQTTFLFKRLKVRSCRNGWRLKERDCNKAVGTSYWRFPVKCNLCFEGEMPGCIFLQLKKVRLINAKTGDCLLRTTYLDGAAWYGMCRSYFAGTRGAVIVFNEGPLYRFSAGRASPKRIEQQSLLSV